MWKTIRDCLAFFRPQTAGARASAAEPDLAMRLDRLRVVPDEGEDFDADRCTALLRSIADKGYATVDEAIGVGVTLEEFFAGNRTTGSIAANRTLPPPLDTAVGWYDLLCEIRDQADVSDVFVEIAMIEPYEDGRLGIWPYADAVWIYSTLDRDRVADLVSPLEPDEILIYPDVDGRELRPPKPPTAGLNVYWVWWD